MTRSGVRSPSAPPTDFARTRAHDSRYEFHRHFKALSRYSTSISWFETLILAHYVPKLIGELTDLPPLVADAIRDCSRRGERVLDIFGGSGSTLIAAHTCGRQALLLELDPACCDTIITRWQTYTGKKAVLADQALDWPSAKADTVPQGAIRQFKRQTEIIEWDRQRQIGERAAHA
ncbi:MAG: hypothetical protein KF914_07790 [Rhizobiaceae bacterium]|nr:hypothetical protein [Rhizobiaceae bacterium]